MKSKATISVKNLSKTFDHNKVLTDINFEVDKGESLVIIGGSGSGKSVLLKCIAGLMMPDKNSSVFFNHQNVTYQHLINRNWLNKRFSMLFQHNALFDSLPVWHNICFSLINTTNISKKDAIYHASEKLTLVGLSDDILYKYPSELSGGMQKRVAIARALSNEPSIIFFDEPTSGLDPLLSETVTKLIATLVKSQKLTAVTITHDIKVMQKIADKVILLDKGKIVWNNSIEKTNKSDNEYLKMFINS